MFKYQETTQRVSFPALHCYICFVSLTTSHNFYEYYIYSCAVSENSCITKGFTFPGGQIESNHETIISMNSSIMFFNRSNFLWIRSDNNISNSSTWKYYKNLTQKYWRTSFLIGTFWDWCTKKQLVDKLEGEKPL